MIIFQQLEFKDIKFLFKLSFFSGFCLTLTLRLINTYCFHFDFFTPFLLIGFSSLFFCAFLFFDSFLLKFFQFFSSSSFLKVFLSTRLYIPFTNPTVLGCVFFYWIIIEKNTQTSPQLGFFVFLVSSLRVVLLIFSSFTFVFSSPFMLDYKISGFFIKKTDILRHLEGIQIAAKAAKAEFPFDKVAGVAAVAITSGSYIVEKGQGEKTRAQEKMEAYIAQTNERREQCLNKIDHVYAQKASLLGETSKNPAVLAAEQARLDEKLQTLGQQYSDWTEHKKFLEEKLERVEQTNAMAEGVRFVVSPVNQLSGKQTGCLSEIVANARKSTFDLTDKHLANTASSVLERFIF